MYIRMTVAQSEARAKLIQERLNRPTSQVMQDIERERSEANALYIWWIARGGKP